MSFKFAFAIVFAVAVALVWINIFYYTATGAFI